MVASAMAMAGTGGCASAAHVHAGVRRARRGSAAKPALARAGRGATAWASLSPSPSSGPSGLGDDLVLDKGGFVASRRGVAALAAASLAWGGPWGAAGGGAAFAGSNFPAGETGDAPVTWRPSARETPSIRAGQIKGYSFLLPPGWKQEQVANILSGNYCQPKCDEPWVEVIFSSKDSGKVNVFGCPSTKLKPYGFKAGMPIEDIVTPESAIASLGGYATGNTIDPDSEVISIDKHEIKGKTYYLYEMLTPYAKTGLHQLAAVTSAQEAVLMFSVSATKDQWANAKDTLKQMVNSFEVDI